MYQMAEKDRDKRGRRLPISPPHGRLYSLYEAAEWTGVCYETLRRMVKTGKLAGGKVGKQWRIPEDALIAFIESRKEDEPGS